MNCLCVIVHSKKSVLVHPGVICAFFLLSQYVVKYQIYITRKVTDSPVDTGTTMHLQSFLFWGAYTEVPAEAVNCDFKEKCKQ